MSAQRALVMSVVLAAHAAAIGLLYLLRDSARARVSPALEVSLIARHDPPAVEPLVVAPRRVALIVPIPSVPLPTMPILDVEGPAEVEAQQPVREVPVVAPRRIRPRRRLSRRSACCARNVIRLPTRRSHVAFTSRGRSDCASRWMSVVGSTVSP